jgi:hypothetical protein
VTDPTRERRVNLGIGAGVLFVAAVLGIGAAVTWTGGPEAESVDCSAFEFDRTRWETEPDEVAFGLVRCKGLAGLRTSEVTAMLGEPHEIDRRSNRWVYSASEVHDELGPGDAQTLFIRFDAGRVIGASLAYEGDRAG